MIDSLPDRAQITMFCTTASRGGFCVRLAEPRRWLRDRVGSCGTPAPRSRSATWLYVRTCREPLLSRVRQARRCRWYWLGSSVGISVARGSRSPQEINSELLGVLPAARPAVATPGAGFRVIFPGD